MLFEEELLDALDRIRAAPLSGNAYQAMPGREHRRVLMPESRCHVYYRVAGPDHVRIVAGDPGWGDPPCPWFGPVFSAAGGFVSARLAVCIPLDTASGPLA